MLYMWRLESKRPEYIFQTDEKTIANQLKRRQGFKLVGEGLNCPLWIFQTEISRPDNAKRMFKHISGGKIKYNPNEDVFYSS
jgi:hypothetical protein